VTSSCALGLPLPLTQLLLLLLSAFYVAGAVTKEAKYKGDIFIIRAY
jgi:hypothetical protein